MGVSLTGTPYFKFTVPYGIPVFVAKAANGIQESKRNHAEVGNKREVGSNLEAGVVLRWPPGGAEDPRRATKVPERFRRVQTSNELKAILQQLIHKYE